MDSMQLQPIRLISKRQILPFRHRLQYPAPITVNQIHDQVTPFPVALPESHRIRNKMGRQKQLGGCMVEAFNGAYPVRQVDLMCPLRYHIS